MILRTQVTLSVGGEKFIPSKVAAPFTKAEDPGEIGKSGRYRGLPVPSGSASFTVPEDQPEKIAYLHRLVMPLLPSLRAAGADDFTLWISYHCDSESIGFSKEEIEMLADFECDVPINCFRTDIP